MPRHPDPTRRLFLAVWPPTEVVERLAAVPRPPRPGLRWVRPAHWHLTLRFIGRAEPDPVAEAVTARVAQGLRPATVELGPTVGPLGPSVLVVPATGLDELAAELTLATAGLGRPPEHRPYRGHLTLARLRRDADPAIVDEVTGTPVCDRFPVTEIRLVASDTRPEGARYRPLHRWPLPST